MGNEVFVMGVPRVADLPMAPPKETRQLSELEPAVEDTEFGLAFRHLIAPSCGLEIHHKDQERSRTSFAGYS
jgi:hypothetical protein